MRFKALLALADIATDGRRPWDLRVLDDRLFRRVGAGGLVALGDAYVDGWWECDALDQLFDRCLRADLPARLPPSIPVLADYLRQRLLNLQTPMRASRHGRAHYDRGNDLFGAMLDSRMVYSCAYWENADTLEQAQLDKLELICGKLGLRPGMRLLDIGCGWGGLARHAAERYGCSVVGITVSPEQAGLARQRCRGLPVEVRVQDYRELGEPFDRIVSVGMFEHVGQRNHREFMGIVARCLADPESRCLLHFFATGRSWPNLRDTETLWVQRHIFPGMVIPSLAQVGAALEGVLVLDDLHNIGAHYDPTLMAWFANFDRKWPALRARYGERFYRVWKYYLLCAAGAFRSRKYGVWQLVLSRAGVRGGYRPVRSIAERAAPAEVAVVVSPERAAALRSPT